MMKRKILCFLAFIIIGITALVSCSSNFSATGTLKEEYVTRHTMCVTASVNDPEGEVTSGSVQIGVYDSEGKRKTYDPCKDLVPNDSEKNTKTVTLTSLDANTEYTVKLLCTIGDEQQTLSELTVSTNKLGNDENNPIMISTKSDFDKIKNDYSGYYKLANDIMIGTEETYEQWNPLFSGNASASFTGTIDGDGHSIKYFKQTTSTTYYGFFGHLASGSVVKNLTIENASIEASRYSDTSVGMIAGYVGSGATVENVNVKSCNIKVSTSTTNNKVFYVGGAVGQNDSGKISGVHVSDTTFDVTASQKLFLGGLVGQNDSVSDTHLTNSTADTTITVNQKYESTMDKSDMELLQVIGGLVGKNKNTGSIKYCASNMKLTSKYDISKTTQDSIYAKKDTDDKSENPEKEWKLDNVDYNVVIGNFVGMNSGVIMSCAASGSINFESISAFSVKIGMFCGADLQNLEGLVRNVAYLKTLDTNEINIKVKPSELSTQDDKATEPEYTRILKFSFANESLTKDAYFESPKLLLSDAVDNELGTSSENYNDFGFTEAMMNFFKSLA